MKHCICVSDHLFKCFRPREQNRDKCFQYWPEKVKETKIISGLNNSFDSFEVTSLRSKEFGPDCPSEGICNHANSHWYRVTLLHIKNLRVSFVLFFYFILNQVSFKFIF